MVTSHEQSCMVAPSRGCFSDDAAVMENIEAVMDGGEDGILAFDTNKTISNSNCSKSSKGEVDKEVETLPGTSASAGGSAPTPRAEETIRRGERVSALM